MHIEELKRCADSFPYFARNYVKLSNPIKGLIPFELHPFQERLIEAYEDEKFIVLVKFRQGGFTTLSVIHALWLCMFRLDQNIMIGAKTDKEAVHIGRIVSRVIENFPEWLKPKLSRDNQHMKKFTSSNSILCFYSLVAGRGRALTRLIIDEAAFIPGMEEKWKSVYPAITGKGSSCVVQSITNGIGNWFHDVYRDAEKGDNNFSIFHTDYREHPDMTPEIIAILRERLGENGFLQELEGKFLVGDDYHEGRLPQDIANDLLSLASKKHLSKRERSACFDAAHLLRNMAV